MQEVDHVGALLGARNSGERHRGPGDIAARIGEELVEFVEAPVATFALHRRRIIETRFGCPRSVYDTPQIGPDPIGAAFLKGMTSLALSCGGLALFDRGLGQERLDRLLRLLGRARFLTLALLLDGDVVARLARLLGRENGAGSDIERERDQAGGKDSAKDLVEFEGVHRNSAPGAGLDSAGRVTVRTLAAAIRYRFASPLATRISACGIIDSRHVQPGMPATSMPHAIILIPARLASTRLPGKPLADLHGIPMIVQVLRRAEAARIGEAVVATDSEAVAAAVEKAGGRAVMTRSDHVSGSDRIYEALEALDPEHLINVVVNLQGDLPTIDPTDIRTALKPLDDATVDIATLAAVIADPAERTNPNVVKVSGPQIAHDRLHALKFTRSNATGPGPHYHHIGLYAYRRAALERFVKLPPSVNEQREKLEQLRALDAGMRIDVMVVDSVPLGVDTPEDLDKARRLLAG